MRLARRTPARKNCSGTRTFTVVWPFIPVMYSSASTSTRMYLARVFTGVSVNPLPGMRPLNSVVEAGSGSIAASRRSASSAVILPAASISRILRRCSFITISQVNELEDADANIGSIGGDTDLRAGQCADQIPKNTERIPGADLAGDRQAEEDDEDERRQQDRRNPEKEQWNPERNRAPVGRFDMDNGNVWSHFSSSSARIASAGVSSPLLSRFSTSVREGDGLLSTNSSWLEMRLSLALMVG